MVFKKPLLKKEIEMEHTAIEQNNMEIPVSILNFAEIFIKTPKKDNKARTI